MGLSGTASSIFERAANINATTMATWHYMLCCTVAAVTALHALSGATGHTVSTNDVGALGLIRPEVPFPAPVIGLGRLFFSFEQVCQRGGKVVCLGGKKKEGTARVQQAC